MTSTFYSRQYKNKGVSKRRHHIRFGWKHNFRAKTRLHFQKKTAKLEMRRGMSRIQTCYSSIWLSRSIRKETEYEKAVHNDGGLKSKNTEKEISGKPTEIGSNTLSRKTHKCNSYEIERDHGNRLGSIEIETDDRYCNTTVPEINAEYCKPLRHEENPHIHRYSVGQEEDLEEKTPQHRIHKGYYYCYDPPLLGINSVYIVLQRLLLLCRHFLIDEIKGNSSEQVGSSNFSAEQKTRIAYKNEIINHANKGNIAVFALTILVVSGLLICYVHQEEKKNEEQWCCHLIRCGNCAVLLYKDNIWIRCGQQSVIFILHTDSLEQKFEQEEYWLFQQTSCVDGEKKTKNPKIHQKAVERQVSVNFILHTDSLELNFEQEKFWLFQHTRCLDEGNKTKYPDICQKAVESTCNAICNQHNDSMLEDYMKMDKHDLPSIDEKDEVTKMKDIINESCLHCGELRTSADCKSVVRIHQSSSEWCFYFWLFEAFGRLMGKVFKNAVKADALTLENEMSNRKICRNNDISRSKRNTKRSSVMYIIRHLVVFCCIIMLMKEHCNKKDDQQFVKHNARLTMLPSDLFESIRSKLTSSTKEFSQPSRSIKDFYKRFNFIPEVHGFVYPLNPVNDMLSKYFTANPPKKTEVMKLEMLRICTLHDFPKESGQSCIRLAQAGFFYEGNGDELICFECGIHVSGWTPSHNPVIRHIQMAPHCKFVKTLTENSQSGSDSGYDSSGASGSSSYGSSVATGSSGYSSSVATGSSCYGSSVGTGSSCCGSSVGTGSSGYGSSVGTGSSGYGSSVGTGSSGYGSSVATGSSVGSHYIPKPKSESQNVADNAGNQVRHSNDSFSTFENGDRSGNNTASNISHPQRQNSNTNQRNTDNSQLHVSQTNVPSSHTESGTQNSASTATNRTKARYPAYVLKVDRLQSFARRWPDYVAQTPQMMEESGFFYAGYDDCVRCFQCGVGLRNWEPPDNPHVEHARWSPKCPFLLSIKGQNFINLVLDAVAQLAEREAAASSATSSTQAANGKEPKTAKIIPKQGQRQTTTDAGQRQKQGSSLSETEATKTSDLQTFTDKSGKQKAKETQSYGLKGGNERIPTNAEISSEVTALKNKNREMRELTQCKICMEEQVSIVFLPCGHLVACSMCSPALSRCAVCRKPITGTIEAKLDV